MKLNCDKDTVKQFLTSAVLFSIFVGIEKEITFSDERPSATIEELGFKQVLQQRRQAEALTV